MSTRNKAMYYDLENRGPYIQTEVKISFSLYKLGYLKNFILPSLKSYHNF